MLLTLLTGIDFRVDKKGGEIVGPFDYGNYHNSDYIVWFSFVF